MRLTEKENGMFLTKQPFTEMINKLGKLEDIMEKYGINSVEELEHIILNDATGEQAFREYVETNVMPYRNIEVELGIDLLTLIKVFTQGFIYMDIKENNKGVSEIIKFEVGGILFDKKDKVWRLTNDDKYDGAYWGSLATNKNYGKTWALTKEELL